MTALPAPSALELVLLAGPRVAALAVLFLVPGVLLLRRRLPADSSALERWALVAGLGTWSVALATSFALLIPFTRLGLHDRSVLPWLPFVVGAGLALVAAFRSRTLPPVPTSRASAGDYAALAMALVVFGLFLVGTDAQSYAATCLTDSLVDFLHPNLRALPLPRANLLVSLETTERLGNVLYMLPFTALLGHAGGRVAAAWSAALAFLALAAVGRRYIGRIAPALVAAAWLVATDDALGSQVVNVNLLTAGCIALLLLLLHPAHARGETRRAFAGAAAFASHYVVVLGLGALVAAVWRDAPEGRRRTRLAAVARTVGRVLLFTLPIHLVHTWHGGSPLQLASFSELGAQVHRFWMWEFSVPAMWNWPFTETLVRTPFNPFPMWIGWPVHLMQQWGVVGVALAGLGAVSWWRAPPPAGARCRWLLFALPLMLFLGVQENWFQPVKLSVGLFFGPLIGTLLGVGVATLLRGSWATRLARIALGLGLSAGLAYGARAILADVSFPADPRFLHAYPDLRRERADDLAFERARWLRVDWLPGRGGAGVLGAWHRKPAEARADLAHTRFEPRPLSVREQALAAFAPAAWQHGMREPGVHEPTVLPMPGPATWLELSLTDPPSQAPQPLRAFDEAPSSWEGALDLRGAAPCVSGPAAGSPVPWSNYAAHVLACRAGTDLFILVAPPEPLGTPHERALWQRAPRESTALASGDSVAWPPPPIALRVPAGIRHVALIDIVHLWPARAYLREGPLPHAGPVPLSPAAAWRFN